MSERQSADPAATALFDLIVADRITAVVYAAAKLNIADFLASGAKASSELAKLTGAHEGALRRLMRALVTVGVCRQIENERFELTPIGGHLVSGREHSLRPWALFEGELQWRRWGGLLESVRTGKNADAITGSRSGYTQLSPEAAKILNEAMVAFTRMEIPALLHAYDFSGIKRLIDVGGGYGELLSAILNAYPSMRGSVFDLPHCAEGAREHLDSAGIGERSDFIPGSFFESVPSGADALVLKSIIHNWNDERSLTILGNCRSALGGKGRLLLIDRIMPEVPAATADDCSVAMSDLTMLMGSGGLERTVSEYRDLLNRSGFKMDRVVPAGRLNVIEASFAS